MSHRTGRGLVVELASGDVAASYCGRMLRSIGFRVVKVEPAAGDPLRQDVPRLQLADGTTASARFEYLNAAKESVVDDSGSADGLVAHLLAHADLVLLAADGDADLVHARQAEIAARHPACVRVATSPFGLTGPDRNVPHSDLTDWAGSGYVFINGDPDREPLQGGGPFPAYATGLTACTGALAAWREVQAGGVGRLVDVGTLETMAALHQYTITLYTHQGYIKHRAGNRHAEAHHPVAFLECKDGWVCIAAPGTAHWENVAHAAGVPELIGDARFETSGDRYDHADELDASIRPWLMAHTAAEIAAVLQARRVPASPVVDLVHVLHDEQLAARGFFHPVTIGGTTVAMPGSSVVVRSQPAWTAAPGLGEHTEAITAERATATATAATAATAAATAATAGTASDGNAGAEPIGNAEPTGNAGAGTTEPTGNAGAGTTEPTGTAGAAASAASTNAGGGGSAAASSRARAATAAKGGLLEGVRVLDLTRAWAGPVAGKFLADLGADVIHVEYSTARAGGVVGPKGYPTEPSPGWSWGELPIPALRGANYPDADPGQDAWNRLGFFNKLHRNKKSLCLDLHATEGFEIFQRLVAVSDVVLDNYSPRGARSLGVIFDLLRELNPRIVVVSITGYGHTGPGSDRVALGPIIEAESGLAAASGYHKGPPMKFGAALPDAISGLNGAIAVLAGLAERDATGEGQFVDLSMLESFVGIGGELVLSTSASGAAPDRRGNRSERYAPQGVYRCAGDDEWVSLTVRTDEQWTALVGLIGAGPLADPRFADEATRRHEQPYLDHVIGAWTAARTKWEATQQLRAVGVVAMPVLSSGDIVHDAQLASRGFMVEWDQPGVGPRLYPGIPLHFEPEFEHEVRPAAPLGRDNREILRDLLGYDDDAITALEQRGVLADRPD